MEKQATPMSPFKYKFLRRSIAIQDGSPYCAKLLAYSKVKRLYLRKIDEMSWKKKKSPYDFKGKQLNCLSSLKPILGRSDTLSLVKRCKNLKSVHFILPVSSSSTYLIRMVKAIPKRVEMVQISGQSVKVTVENLHEFYRGLGTCGQLQVLKANLNWRHVQDKKLTNEDRNEIERNFMHRYISRLRNLDEFESSEPDLAMQGLTKSMKKDWIWPFVTHRSLALTRNITEEDNARLKSFEEEEKIPPILRFKHFPNLKKLEITSVGIGVFFVPSIVEVFKYLPQLEQYALKIRTRSLGGFKFFFGGLVHLPLLKSFELAMAVIEYDEQQLLIEFLRKQTRLVSLNLSIITTTFTKKQYEEYNHSLEMICESLNDKDNLKYLTLKATCWPLETLSKGLSQIKMTNQLKELDIECFDDISVVSSTPISRVEGLCHFIRKRKESLQKLRILIDFVKEDEIVDGLIQTVAEIDKLKSLSIVINTKRSNMLENHPILCQIRKESVAGYPFFKDTFTLIDQALRKMNQLNQLEFTLYPIENLDAIRDINSSVVFNALSTIRSLGSLTLQLPYLEKSIQSHPTQLQLLSQIKSLAHILIRSFNINTIMKATPIKEVEEFLKQTESRRYLNTNLTY